MFFKFRTAPAVKSETVLKLERTGRTIQLLQAIEAERKNPFSNTGSSSNGQIKVERVGAFGNKKVG
jgi:hypothetical protein